MGTLSEAKLKAYTTPKSQIRPGTAEAAYQAIDAVKVLWSFKSNHSDSWIDALDRLFGPPPAWELIPEDNPYNDADIFFDQELSVNKREFAETVKAIAKLTDYQLDFIDTWLDEPLGIVKNKTNVDIINISDTIHNRPDGTSRQAGLRRLRAEKKKAEKNKDKKRFEQVATLHEMVKTGGTSVNAALIELGIRKKTITLPLDVEKAASTLKRHFEPDQIVQLINLLQS